MVERNRFLSVLTHLVLLAGVAVVAFPIYMTLVASTHTAQEIIQVPMPLTPGDALRRELPGRLHRPGHRHGLERAGGADDDREPGHGAA